MVPIRYQYKRKLEVSTTDNVFISLLSKKSIEMYFVVNNGLLWSCQRHYSTAWCQMSSYSLLDFISAYQALEKRPYINPVRRLEVRTKACLKLLYCTGVPAFPHITRAFRNVVQEFGSTFWSPPSSTWATDAKVIRNLESSQQCIWSRNGLRACYHADSSYPSPVRLFI